MKDIRDPGHTFLIKVNLSDSFVFILTFFFIQPFKFDSNEPDREAEPYYENGTYVDEWDPQFVRLPCSQSYITVIRWIKSEKNLIR